MEDIKKLLEENDYLISSSDENESDNESLSVWSFEKHDDLSSEINCSNSTAAKKRNGEKRLPTRRPDPNVYNRNALLARENRRKKKEYLETIEKELQIARKTNRVLAKALKRQLKVAKRFEQEKKYLEGLIANRSEILTLVNALNFRSIPELDSDKSPFSAGSNNGDFNFNSIKDRSSTTSLSGGLNDADSLSIQFDSISDGSVAAPLDNSLCDFSSFDFCNFPNFFTDLENGSENCLPSTSTNWDDIWGENGYHIDNLILPQSALIHNKNGMQNINNDHCYIATTSLNSIQTPEQKSDATDYIDVEGDSVHNDVLCSTSSWNLTCRTPPLQLLSDHSSSS